VPNDEKGNPSIEQTLLKKARNVLDKNWLGHSTIPSPVLYPHQWSWDSAFIAIGNSYFNTDRAIQEIKTLFNAQWKNGMVPHIVFNESKKDKADGKVTYFPTPDFYDSAKVTKDAPKHVKTSALTQPPVHAIACYYIYANAHRQADKKKAKEFLKEIYPKLRDFHIYLLTARDPENSGQVTIFHPWESGLDNLPIWDEPLSRIEIQKDDLPKFERLDILAVHGAKETRTDEAMYAKFIYLVKLMREKYDYNLSKMYKDFPFKVKDIVFSSILYVANSYLLKILNTITEDDDNNINYNKIKDLQMIKGWISKTEQNYFKYFTPTQKLEGLEADDLYDYDLIKKGWIEKRTIASLIPIYTDIIPKEKIHVLVKWIDHAHYCGQGNCHVAALPSTDLSESYFREANYWRGPVWINTNWMIYLGLLKYGYKKRAEQIRQGIFELALNHGFREYYDPFTGQGLGGSDFSWSAALVIDMILRRGSNKNIHNRNTDTFSEVSIT
jgi:mannosylglycerate hydrolase MGH1-like protein